MFDLPDAFIGAISAVEVEPRKFMGDGGRGPRGNGGEDAAEMCIRERESHGGYSHGILGRGARQPNRSEA